MSDFVRDLRNAVDAEWAAIRTGEFYIRAKEQFSRDMYVGIMIQMFHYTRNNSINQACAAFSTCPSDTSLLRFVYKHALEELGHEQMIVRDLAAFDITDDVVSSALPLPATDALNGYLQSVALRQGAVARLGYSFWAESAYDHIGPLVQSAKRSLGLNDRQMTFLVAHAEIDKKHSAEVASAIDEWVVTEQDRKAVKQVATTTLYLTGKIMEGVARECV